MKKPIIIEYELKYLDTFVDQQLVRRAATTTIFALQGALGVGKTTISKSFLRQLGITEPVVSPTFAYVNRYKLPSGRQLFHFDLYRIESIEQFFKLGFEEYCIEPDVLCLIEWPEIIFPILKNLGSELAICFIKLEYNDFEGRLSEKRRAILADFLCTE